MPQSFHTVNVSKALTYLSISLGKTTSWIANVKASRSSRPPPKACSRQVSTDETRKQVRTTMKRMAMMIVQGLPRPWPQASAARHADFSNQIQSNYEQFVLDFRATKRRSGKKTFLNTEECVSQ